VVRRIASRLAVIMTVAACTQIVGPARTFRDYELKASSTASSALSAVRTAQLVMRLGRGDDAFAPYLSVNASEAEDDAMSASGTFDGIQPPDRRAQALGDRLRDLLDPATAAVRDVRIRARRTELGTADPALERRLARSARALDRFETAHT
jgi:hypothetical protein